MDKRLQNLRRADYSQNFFTRVASQFNWLLRQTRAARGHFAHCQHSATSYAMSNSVEFSRYSKERREKIVEIDEQLRVISGELMFLERMLIELPDTPMLSPEAKQTKIAARNARRRELRRKKKQP